MPEIPINITETEAKSILRKMKRIDSWFLTGYGMNLYRGCTHNCSYCDGRAEGYYVEGDFGCDVSVKTNAINILKRELDPSRKRVPFKPCYMMLGGGVGDAYQPVEAKYGLARQVLELFDHYDMPVHILTKSMLVERDLDLILRIHEKKRAMISMSFSTVDDDIAARFEPGVPPPSERLAMLGRFREQGIVCGMFLLPVIPFVSDTNEQIDSSVQAAAEAGLNYIHFGGLTLKDGRQRRFFESVLKEHDPELLPAYARLYRGDRWGQAVGGYYNQINKRFYQAAVKHKMPMRVPFKYFEDMLAENDKIQVMLDQMAHVQQLQGVNSPYGYASWAVSQLKEPVLLHKDRLESIKGINRQAAQVIRDILKTGASPQYEKMLAV